YCSNTAKGEDEDTYLVYGYRDHEGGDDRRMEVDSVALGDSAESLSEYVTRITEGYPH
ncbi:hypothetical protein J6590_096094, partial [Homalodisca vitripennis]